MADGNAVYSSANGVLYNKEQTTLIQYPKGKTGNFTIPGSVTTIGDAAFLSCDSLTSVTLPNSVTTIGKYAFVGCFGLTSVTIPSSVTTIGGYAFEDTHLTSITSLNPIPPAVEKWLGANYTTCTLYVPEGSIDAYKNQWSAFYTIAAVTTSVATASTSAAKVYALAGTLYVEGAAQPYTVHSLTGAQVYVGSATSLTLPSGMYVVSIGKERHKVVVR